LSDNLDLTSASGQNQTKFSEDIRNGARSL
jgi:hypothetical protein